MSASRDKEYMTEMTWKVRVTVPARMTPLEVRAELGTCISFGKPVITKLAEQPIVRYPQMCSP